MVTDNLHISTSTFITSDCCFSITSDEAESLAAELLKASKSAQPVADAAEELFSAAGVSQGELLVSMATPVLGVLSQAETKIRSL